MEAELRADPARRRSWRRFESPRTNFKLRWPARQWKPPQAGGPRAFGPSRKPFNFPAVFDLGHPAGGLSRSPSRARELRRAHGTGSIVALSRPFAETAAKVPAPVTIADSVKATTGSRLDNNIGDIPSRSPSSTNSSSRAQTRRTSTKTRCPCQPRRNRLRRR